MTGTTFPTVGAVARNAHSAHVLIADDEPGIRSFYRLTLEEAGYRCQEAENGQEVLDLCERDRHDLVLLDVDMPRRNGIETCRLLRQRRDNGRLKIILVSGRADPDQLAQMMLMGADDYLIKPFTWIQLRARVETAVRLKQAEERSDSLQSRLLAINRELEGHLRSRDTDLVAARDALVLGLTQLCERRHQETGEHLRRLQLFCRKLAQEARHRPELEPDITPEFLEHLEQSVPLHDIGKVGLPDRILLKPGLLTPEERVEMQAHTIFGAETLERVAREHRFAEPFLRFAIDIARHHHEWFDGSGYPDRLRGTSIPLSARIVAIADVYDALRSPRVYKSALPHLSVVDMMRAESGTHFDPRLFACFLGCERDFERIYDDGSE